MIQNYLKVALRNLSKNKIISSINVIGLAVGIACCLLIAFLIRREFSFAKFHRNPEQIYRILPDLPNSKVPSLPFPLLPALKAEFPEISQAVRLLSRGALIKIGQDIIDENILYADSDFFEMFNFPIKNSTHKNPFTHEHSVVLSSKAANKYFGDIDPVGEIIEVSQGQEFEPFLVRAVTETIPNESSINFSFLVPISNLKTQLGSKFEDWYQFQVSGFIRIFDGAQLSALLNKLPPFFKKHMGVDLVADHYYAQHKGLRFQSFTEYHLGNETSGVGLRNIVDVKDLYVLTVVATLILSIACFNFVLLSIAQSSTRFKEVGMRKVLGAFPSQLVQQFWLEAILMSFLALIVGVVIAELILPKFNQLAGQKLTIDYANGLAPFLILSGLMLLVGVGVGSYPAFFISRLPTVAIFRGKVKSSMRNLFTRTLIVAQFSLSICLLIITTMITQQLHFMKNKDLGFNSDHIVVIQTQAGSEKRSNGAKLLQYYKNELAENPDIVKVSGASGSFQRGFVTFSFFTQEDGKVSDVGSYIVDENFLRTMELKLIEGRDFLHTGSDGWKSMIVNETFMNDFAEIAKLNSYFPYKILGRERLKIIGVVRDFHFLSLKQHILPAALIFGHGADRVQTANIDCILIRIRPENIAESIDTLKHIWQKYQPNQAFAYNFMDEDLESQYRTEKMWRQIIFYASTLAILIACMGLLGLTSLVLAQRRHEIGIRKVLGASVTQLLQLLNQEIIALVVIANTIAWPLSYFFATQFLQSFAYRTTIDFKYFVLCGLVALFLSVFSVSFLAFRVASKNPVTAIRYEQGIDKEPSLQIVQTR